MFDDLGLELFFEPDGGTEIGVRVILRSPDGEGALVETHRHHVIELQLVIKDTFHVSMRSDGLQNVSTASLLGVQLDRLEPFDVHCNQSRCQFLFPIRRFDIVSLSCGCRFMVRERKRRKEGRKEGRRGKQTWIVKHATDDTLASIDLEDVTDEDNLFDDETIGVDRVKGAVCNEVELSCVAQTKHHDVGGQEGDGTVDRGDRRLSMREKLLHLVFVCLETVFRVDWATSKSSESNLHQHFILWCVLCVSFAVG